VNKPRKIIWTVYLAFWLYIAFFIRSYDKSDYIFLYLIFGWIPFLIAHFIWRDKKDNKAKGEEKSTI